jgi:hypothetical protein
VEIILNKRQNKKILCVILQHGRDMLALYPLMIYYIHNSHEALAREFLIAFNVDPNSFFSAQQAKGGTVADSSLVTKAEIAFNALYPTLTREKIHELITSCMELARRKAKAGMEAKKEEIQQPTAEIYTAQPPTNDERIIE